jgi:predicted nucleotidyltransferase
MSLDEAKLANIFRAHPDVRAVYLFGSHAEGRARANSDVDLGVVTSASAEALGALKLELLTDLAAAGFDDVDMVMLDRAGYFVRFQAVRLNHPIYVAADFDHGSYFSLTLRLYWDFKKHLDWQRAAYKEKILNAES